LEINAFGQKQSMQNKEIYLPNDLLKIIVFNEKYKLNHKIGIEQLSDFLEKHKITRGDIDGMRKVMKNYNDVLENYKNRKPYKEALQNTMIEIPSLIIKQKNKILCNR